MYVSSSTLPRGNRNSSQKHKSIDFRDDLGILKPQGLNSVITGLLIWRIKQALNTTKFTSNDRLYAFYQRVIRNMIESCVLCPLVLLITSILYCLDNNGQGIFTGSMAQIVSIIPTLMWLQHCLCHSALGNTKTTTHLPTRRTIEFSPNRDPQNTKLDATVAESFTDMEAAGVVVTGGGFNFGAERTVACSANSLGVPFNYSLPPVACFLRSPLDPVRQPARRHSTPSPPGLVCVVPISTCAISTLVWYAMDRSGQTLR
ncbi:hypothetical protein BDM02DRAFT_817605 [Thelephora ganbajun]|uniref:Uncharacterized protein n=1 Tax=Thelephora ganbajun TaxID=370292 RepID=A0ACB6Z603_THEGA|nr:hypothetical protein BDM02DRAFT_817605 [Thelephora ganbajun]